MPPVLYLFLSSAITLIYPQLSRLAIDKAVSEKDLILLIELALAFFLLSMLERLFLYLNETSFAKFQSDSLLQIQKRILQKIFSYPMDFFDQKHSGYLVGRIRGDVLGLNYLFSASLIENIIELLKFIVVLIILISINMKLALLSLCFIPFLVIYMVGNRRGIQRLNEKIIDENSQIEKVLSDTFQGIEVFKSFSNESEGIQIAYKGLSAYQNVEIERNKYLSRFRNIYGFLVHLGEVSLFYFGIRDVVFGKITIGNYVAFLSYIMYLYVPLRNLGNFSHMLDFSRRSLSRIEELLEDAYEEFGSIRNDSIQTIKVRKLKFGYARKDEIILNMNFEIKKGDRVLIRGESGRGKSTLVKLLLGLYRPKEGSILFNDINLSDLDIRHHRQQIGYISQNVFLFNNTVRKNIVFNNENISDEEIYEVLSQCGLCEKISKLTNGIHEMVSEKGLNFSGGERQKIALARALIKNPEVIIIDEGTSNIDLGAEAAIIKLLERKFRERILIWITHRDINPCGWKLIDVN